MGSSQRRKTHGSYIYMYSQSIARLAGVMMGDEVFFFSPSHPLLPFSPTSSLNLYISPGEPAGSWKREGARAPPGWYKKYIYIYQKGDSQNNFGCGITTGCANYSTHEPHQQASYQKTKKKTTAEKNKFFCSFLRLLCFTYTRNSAVLVCSSRPPPRPLAISGPAEFDRDNRGHRVQSRRRGIFSLRWSWIPKIFFLPVIWGILHASQIGAKGNPEEYVRGVPHPL